MDPLTSLAVRHGSDKAQHGFCAFYHRLLESRRGQIARVLEIGVFQGASLKMWRDYLPHAMIYGVDSDELSILESERIAILRGDQASRSSLNRVVAATGTGFDLIVDDGGHTMEQQQVSLGLLFPHLRPGGLYVIEDLHTSFAAEIIWQREGRVVGRYPTGAGDGGPTTYAVVEALASGKPPSSLHLSAPETAFLAQEARGVQIFDRDGDRSHMTCALWRNAE